MMNKQTLQAFASFLLSKPIYIGIGLSIYLCVVIGMFGINFPYADQWEAVLFLEKFKNHSLTFHDLFAQHNEHRIFFPKLIMLLEANLSHWNIFFELFTNVFLGICIYWLNFKALSGLEEKAGKSNFSKNHLIIIISLLLLSTAQYENWMWGWQIQIFLSILMVCWGIISLNQSQNSVIHLLIAIAAGIIATFSFANGLLYWIIGILILFRQKRKVSLLLFWMILSVLMIGLYFHNYHRPSEHPIPQLSFSYLINYIAFVFAYLGNPIFESDANASLICGILGVLIYFYTWSRIIFAKNINRKSYEVFLYLSFYGIISAFITGLGRTGLGLSIAAASRYVTISNLFWIANFVGIFLFLSANLYKSMLHKRMLEGLLVLLFLAISVSHVVGTTKIMEHQRVMNEVKTGILSGNATKELLKNAYPKPEIILKRDTILAKYTWSYRYIKPQ